MKRNYRVFAAAASVLAAVACAKEAYNNSDVILPGELTISAGIETSKAYLEAGVIKWKSSDILTVFDTAGDGVDFKAGAISADKKSCDFSTASWTGKTPTYAVAYNAEWDETRVTSCTSSAVLPVRVRKTQNNHSWKGCSSPFANASVGIVSKNEEDQTYSITQMKNVVGYIGINLSKSTTKKITVESLGDEPLAGWVDVDYNKLIGGETDFWTLRQGESGDDVITLSTAESGGSIVGGCFGAGTYYIGVLPQTYADGIKLTLYDASGNVITERTIGADAGITIKRSELTPVGGNADVIPVALPDEVTIDLDFASGTNPFGFSDPGVDNENPTTGETYPITYNFTDAKTGLPASVDFDFVICRTSTANTHYYYKELTNNVYGTGYVLVFDAKNSWICLPAIEGRYLSEITIYTGNGADKEFNIKDSGAATSSVAIVKVTKGTASAPGSRTLHFYTNGNDGTNTSLQGNTVSIGKSYYLQMRTDNGSRIARLTIKYAKTLPTK